MGTTAAAISVYILSKLCASPASHPAPNLRPTCPTGPDAYPSAWLIVRNKIDRRLPARLLEGIPTETIA